MATLNYAAREVSCKIVYYGPALGGKTTNLQWIHATVNEQHRGQMISLATDQDRTLFFDFLPLDLGQVSGFRTKFQLYTVPGQVYYNATRKLVLRGVDGLVFVVDSAPGRLQDNLDSLINLQENLAEYEYRLGDLPWVIQYNKRDLPDAMPIDEMERRINRFGVEHAEAVATRGEGVKETLQLIAGQVLKKLSPRPGAEAPARAGAAAGAMDSPACETLRRRPSEAAVSQSAAPEVEKTPWSPRTSPVPRADAGIGARGGTKGPARLAIRQRCDVYWRGLRVGTASIELTSRSNLDGQGEYQLAEASRFLLAFPRVRVDVLAFRGEQTAQTGSERTRLYVFGGAKEGNGERAIQLRAWVCNGADQSLLVRRRGRGGEYAYTPAGRGGPAGLAWARLAELADIA